MLSTSALDLQALHAQVIACQRCPRLVEYCARVAAEKRRMYRQQEYWGKPLPGFGGATAHLLIVGLAPAAHGGNRTGRMFTGDRSGDFLYRALYDAGFASQPESRHRDDGLRLQDCYITAALRCAPPANKPLPVELQNCRDYLVRELELLTRVKAVLALGRIGFEAYLKAAELRLAKAVRSRGEPPTSATAAHVAPAADARLLPPRTQLKFAHGSSFDLGPNLPRLFASYHPSQQNTQTGRLTPAMMRSVLHAINRYLRQNASGN
jgi:uracil-DNA glycosylase family 4